MITPPPPTTMTTTASNDYGRRPAGVSGESPLTSAVAQPVQAKVKKVRGPAAAAWPASLAYYHALGLRVVCTSPSRRPICPPPLYGRVWIIRDVVVVRSSPRLAGIHPLHAQVGIRVDGARGRGLVFKSAAAVRICRENNDRALPRQNVVSSRQNRSSTWLIFSSRKTKRLRMGFVAKAVSAFGPTGNGWLSRK